MVADNNIVRQKCRLFSVRVYKLYKYLTEERGEFILSKQILRSGTSIGANLAEAKCAMTPADFLAKVYIAYKECSETLYWLELLKDIELITDAWFDSINYDCTEIMKLLTVMIKKKKQDNIK